MRFDIIAAVVGFVLQTGDKIFSAFIDKKFGKDNQRNLPAKIETVRQDTRIRQAEIDYYNRRETREKELLQIQDLRLKTDIQIAAVQAAKEERALQLKQEELEDKRKLSALYLDVIREKTSKEIEIKKQEIQAIFDQQKWPGVLSRDEVQRIFIEEQQKSRLLMLVPPPDISEDFPISFRDSLNKEIRNQLKIFLEKYYPLQGDLCPVEFYGKYFERSIFDAEVKQLETILSAVPTAIIYTDITDHEVYFNIRFWGLQEPVSLSFEPWNWEEVKRQLEESGNDENQSFRAIRKTIVTLHKFLAAFLADWYYLNIDPNYEPQLFNIEADIPPDWTSKLHSQLSSICQNYRAIYNKDLQLIADLESIKRRNWRCLNTLSKHSTGVFCIAINPNGKTFASSSSDKTIQVWNLHQSELIGTFTGHSDYVRTVTFSPDGQILASGSDDKKVKLWFAKTGTIFTGYSDLIYSIVFSPNGQCIATGSGDGNIKIWDINTEELICQLNGHESAITSIIFDINGRQLISASRDHTIKMWDVKSGLAIYTLKEHSNWVNTVAISPNNKTFASGSNDKTIKLWNLQNGELIHTFSEHSSPISSVAFSPNGQLLASGGHDNMIKLWHIETKELINTFSGHSGIVNSVAFSVDGKNIVSGSSDNTIKIWGYE